jgi:hypothetical protein
MHASSAPRTCSMRLPFLMHGDQLCHVCVMCSLPLSINLKHTTQAFSGPSPSSYTASLDLTCFSSSITVTNDAMRGPNTKAFQQGFVLKNMISSLQACCNISSSRSAGGATATMSLQQRKRAIKASADIAMAASARGGGARWPQAVLASSSSSSPSARPPSSPPPGKKKKNARGVCKKKVVRRSCLHHTRRRRRRDGSTAGASSSSLARTTAAMATTLGSCREIARRLVRKRTTVLRKMIPGGELLHDEISLLHEAVDYVAHLHAQVDALRRISNAVQRARLS